MAKKRSAKKPKSAFSPEAIKKALHELTPDDYSADVRLPVGPGESVDRKLAKRIQTRIEQLKGIQTSLETAGSLKASDEAILENAIDEANELASGDIAKHSTSTLNLLMTFSRFVSEVEHDWKRLGLSEYRPNWTDFYSPQNWMSFVFWEDGQAIKPDRFASRRKRMTEHPDSTTKRIAFDKSDMTEDELRRYERHVKSGEL